MRRPERFGTIILATVLVVGCAGAPDTRRADDDLARPSPIAQRSVNTAQALLDRGDAAGALAEADRAIDADGRSAAPRVMRGMALEALGRGVEAGEAYKQAIRIDPESGPVLNAYGVWLCRAGRTDEALKAFNDALADAAYRQVTQALANAGSCAAEAQRDDQADMNFRAALSLAPESIQALSGMAKLEHRRGDALGARAFMQRREAVAPLTAPELALAVEIETAAGDDRAAARYRDQLAELAAQVAASASNADTGSPRQ